MKRLAAAGLVESRREGREVRLELTEDGRSAVAMVLHGAPSPPQGSESATASA